MTTCIRLYTGADGRSHVERIELPPGHLQAATVLHFEGTEAHSALDWHTAPATT